MKRPLAMLAMFALVAPLPAQQEARFADQLEVSVVEVAVNVVGRDGNSVRGLTRANFEVFDDGQKREIEDFEVVDTAPSRVPKGVSARIANPVARRSFLLVFDLTNSVPGTMLRARDAARQFVANDIREGDLTAVSSFSVEHGFRLITAFTSDRDLLISAIDTLSSSKFFRTADPLLLAGDGGQGGDLARSGAQGTGADRQSQIEEIAKDLDRMNRLAEDSFRRSRVEEQIDTFAGIAKILDRMRGRKQLILLSEGFDASLLQGRENLTSTESRDDATNVVAGESFKVDNDRRFGNTAAADRLRRMGEIFRRSDIVLHCIDIKGLRSNVDARVGLKENSNEGLHLLANTTGGQVFKNDNDLAASFDRLVREQEVTYVLTFRAPRTKTPGAFHNLKVRLRGVNGARIFHRAGYYEAGGKLTSMEQTLSAIDIMMSDVPLNDVQMSILAAPFPAAGANAQVPVIIELPGPQLMEGVSDNDLEAELFVYAFDKGGSVEDFLYQRLALDLSKVSDALRKSGIKYYGTLSLPAGDYELKTLVRVRNANRDGFQSSRLHVPDFGLPTVLRPFLFEEPGKWIMVKGGSHAGSAEYPFRIAESFIPSAGGVIEKSKEARVALFTYNIGEKIELSARVADASGTARDAKLSLVGRTPVDDDGSTKLLFEFVPAGLAPGSYVLAFDIRDTENAKSQSVSLPITVQ